MENAEKRTWDLPSIFMLTGIMWVAALRLWVTDWTQHLERIELLGMFAIILGFALGRSNFKPRTVRWLGFLYSIIIVPWELALIVDASNWNDRLYYLGRRLGETIWIFFHNQPIQDPILFITSMAVLYWIVTVMAAYQLVRYRRPWMPVIVTSVSVILIEYYNPTSARASLLTVIFMFLVLMLVGRLYLINRREDWRDHNVTVDAEAGFDISRGTIVAGVLLVVMAWNFPTVVKALTPGTQEQQWVQVSWQGLRNRFSNVVASLRSPVTVVTTDFGNTLGLGTGAASGDDQELVVTPSLPLPSGIHLYMRGRTYDNYTNGVWSNSITDLASAKANTNPFAYPVWSPFQTVDVTVTNYTSASRTLYSPGRPMSASKSGKAQVEKIDDKTVDVVSLLSDTIIQTGESYRVEGAVSVPTQYQLRNAPAVYPDWVKQHYLEVPVDFPESIKKKAEEITSGLENTYDKSEAITNWLRNNITYSLSIPTPPANTEPLDWFLFSYKQGYCNYYASAEVMMLRSIGIPARMVVGYAEGETQDGGKSFLIKRKDSHAWPEVYFYGAGWVPFEPTVSQPASQFEAGGPNQQQNDVLRGGSPLDFGAQDRLPIQEREPTEGPRSASGSGRSFPYYWVLGGLLVLLLAGLVVFQRLQVSRGRWKPFPQMMERRLLRSGKRPPEWLMNWARFTELTPIERIFAGIPYMIRFLGGKAYPSQTPSERILSLLNFVPEGAPQASVVLQEYERYIYSQHAVNVEEARSASDNLWRQVLRSWIRKHFHIEFQVT